MNVPISEIYELHSRLAAAKERFAAALKALAPKHQGGEWEEYRAAEQERLTG
jgi:hypothetical protein